MVTFVNVIVCWGDRWGSIDTVWKDECVYCGVIWVYINFKEIKQYKVSFPVKISMYYLWIGYLLDKKPKSSFWLFFMFMELAHKQRVSVFYLESF